MLHIDAAWNHKDITVTLAAATLRPKPAGFLPLNKNRYLKSQVYKIPVSAAMDLKAQIVEAMSCIQRTTGQLEDIRDCMRCR